MKFVLYTLNLLCIITSTIAMETIHSVAHQNDTDDIVHLIDNISVLDNNDTKKVVIVPQKFREPSVRSTLAKSRYFISRNNGQLISLRKIFPVIDQNELHEILTSEIRCTATNKELKYTGFFDQTGKYNNCTNDQTPTFNNNDTYVYSGGAYTLPEYRKKATNKQLTDFALSTLKEQLIELIKQKNSKKLIFLYGLVQANAGENGPCSRNDRTPNLVRSFLPFAQEIAKAIVNQPSNLGMDHYRYQAFMPTFDPNADEFKPLSDEHSIPGFGCVLSFNLNNEKE